MKKFILVLFLLGILPNINAQEDSKLYSFTFQNSSLAEAIAKIESETDFQFYYDQNWLANEDIEAKTYQNQSLESILEDLFEETSLNFVFIENKIILTNNNLVYDELPANFFGNDTVTTAATEENLPVFYQEYQIVEEQEVPQEEAPVLSFIGKETKGASGQTHKISGYVRDTQTGRPIPFATISTKEKNINAISDEEGFYSMVLPTGLNILEVSSVGFNKRQQRLMLYNDGVQNFDLTESVNQLEEVLIATDSKENVRAAVTGVSSIDIEEMKNIPMVLGERDVIKVATIMPGVKTVGEGAAGFNVRGGQADQNLILLDEAVLYNPFHFLGFFSAVNPFILKSADLYKGSIPAEHGGRLSSVFDITTKQPNLEKFSGEGGIGPVTSNLTASIPIIKGKAGLLVGGRATYSDWILNVLDEGELKNSEASFYDALVKYHHKITDKDNLDATFYYSNDRFSITSDSLYNYNNLLVSLGWNHRFNDDHSADLYLTHSQYEFDIDYEPETINAFQFGYALRETQLKLKFDYKLNENHNLTYGIASKLYNVNPGTFNPLNPESQLEFLNIQDERGLESAIFLSDSYKVSEDLLVNAGLRYSSFTALGPSEQRLYQEGLPKNDASVVGTEQYSSNEPITTYGGLEYRLSARYFLRDDLSIKGSFDTNNQYIHLLSTNTTQAPTDTWKLSDLNVEPQRSQQYSLGMYKNFERDMYELSVEGYYKRMKNMLDYKVGADILLNENLETELLQGDGKAYGVEFLLKKTRGDLNGWIGYTYSRSFLRLDSEFPEERVNNGNFFPTNFDKPHDFNAVLNYKLTKRYSFSANFIYQTGRPVTYPVGSYNYNGAEYTLYSDRNQFRIPDYYRLDLGINIEGNHKIKKLAHSFWNISVYNVLGRNNPYSVYFVTEIGDVKGYQTSIFSIPVPTITYNFKF